MNEILVSICIPTYNRCQLLTKTINSIICQNEFVEGKAEIIISDNASTDDTEKIGRDFESKFDNIHYYRNEENVRDENYPLCISRANGVLRKLNNDTLMFEHNALKVLCDLVEKYRIDKPYIFLKNDDGKGSSETDFIKFVTEEGYNITWIGSFSIWDSQCKNIQNDTKGCDLLLWQVRKLLELSSSSNRVIICHEKIGKSEHPPKKNISYGLYKVFYINFMKLIEPYVVNGKLTTDNVEKIEKDLLYDFFTQWIIKWEVGKNDLQYSKEENLKELVFSQYKEKTYFNHYKKLYNKKKMIYKAKLIIKRILGMN